MYELLLSNLFTIVVVGCGLFSYHLYTEYKRKQYYENLQYCAGKLLTKCSKLALTYISQYHKMKTSQDIESIKDLLSQVVETNNNHNHNNNNTAKFDFDFAHIEPLIKPLTETFLNSQNKTSEKNNINVIKKLVKKYTSDNNCDNNCDNKCDSDNDSDSECYNNDLSGFKVTI